VKFDPLIGKPDISSRLYVVLCILIYFMQSICPNSSWPQRLREMLGEFPVVPKLTIADMGFRLFEEHLAVYDLAGAKASVDKLIENIGLAVLAS